jgi:hypothetical protein
MVASPPTKLSIEVEGCVNEMENETKFWILLVYAINVSIAQQIHNF